MNNVFSIGNTAGSVKTPHDMDLLARTAITEATIGSYTLMERRGNIGDTFYANNEGTSWNAIGLTNCGIRALANEPLHTMARQAHLARKHLIVSIAGNTPEEYAEMTEVLYAQEPRLRSKQLSMPEIELNFGCPNVRRSDGTRHEIISYHPATAAEYLCAVARVLPAGVKVRVKISPVPDDIIPELAAVIGESGIISSVIAVNTKPDQTGLRENGDYALNYRPTEDSPNLLHVGGMAGTALKPEGIRVVNALCEHLSMDVRIIGAGGIRTGQDVLDYIDTGAAGVQIGTDYFVRQGHAIQSILSEMADTEYGASVLRSVPA